MSVIDYITGLAKRPVGRSTLSKLVLSTVVFVVLVSLAGFVAKQVTDGDTLTKDEQILRSIYAHSNSVLDTVVLGITYTGNLLTVAIITAVLGWFLYKTGMRRSVVQALFTVGGAMVLNASLKLIFQRDRPELWQLLTHESTYSFPSGHALVTASLAMLLILLFWKTKYRYGIVAAATLYTVSVGISRLYLGVHYPTDVLAGWLTGAAWAIIVATVIGTIKWSNIRRSSQNTQ